MFLRSIHVILCILWSFQLMSGAFLYCLIVFIKVMFNDCQKVISSGFIIISLTLKQCCSVARVSLSALFPSIPWLQVQPIGVMTYWFISLVLSFPSCRRAFPSEELLQKSQSNVIRPSWLSSPLLPELSAVSNHSNLFLKVSSPSSVVAFLFAYPKSQQLRSDSFSPILHMISVCVLNIAHIWLCTAFRLLLL